MSFRMLGFAGAAGALFLSFDCGGRVVAGTGGGSSESTGDTASNGTTTESGSNTVAQSTGTPTLNGSTTVQMSAGPMGQCDQVCAMWSGLGCGFDECLEQCAETFAGGCAAELSAYADCLITFAVDCDDSPEECKPEVLAYAECHGGCGSQVCQGGESSGGETFCSCSESCETATYETICSSSAGQGKCECYVDGMLAGQCEDEDASCDVDASCCSQFFFEG
jgi:hypothetical protein